PGDRTRRTRGAVFLDWPRTERHRATARLGRPADGAHRQRAATDLARALRSAAFQALTADSSSATPTRRSAAYTSARRMLTRGLSLGSGSDFGTNARRLVPSAVSDTRR